MNQMKGRIFDDFISPQDQDVFRSNLNAAVAQGTDAAINTLFTSFEEVSSS